jgi:hypothetical protein
MNNNRVNNIVGGNASITSSANLSKINSGDINNLLSMLTSESDNNNNDGDMLENILHQNGGDLLTENTADLENRLTFMLGQTGGSDDNISTDALENRINDIIRSNQSGGAKSLLSLAGLTLAGTMLHKKLSNSTDTETEFNASKIIGSAVNNPMQQRVSRSNSPNRRSVVNSPSRRLVEPSTKNRFNVQVPLDSATSSEMPSRNINTLSETSNNSVFVKQPNVSTNPFIPLTTTTVNNNSNLSNLSATSSAMPMSDKRLSNLDLNQDGGNNPPLIAFREISSMAAKKLNIPNGPKAKKIAGQLQRDVKEKNKDISVDKLVEAARNHLNNNLEKYKKMI